MSSVTDSFAWPFRGPWPARWAPGIVAVLLLPLLFIPLLGYSAAAVREAGRSLTAGPPPWRIDLRLLTDGFWIAAAIVLFTLPFGWVTGRLAGWLHGLSLFGGGAVARSDLFSFVLATCVVALPWGFFFLLLMPHATSSFAASGRPMDMFNVLAAWRGVRRDFPAWNLAAAAIVTGWAVGLACTALLCIGLVPGVFYAILVSAHASATLHHTDPHPSAR